MNPMLALQTDRYEWLRDGWLTYGMFRRKSDGALSGLVTGEDFLKLDHNLEVLAEKNPDVFDAIAAEYF